MSKEKEVEITTLIYADDTVEYMGSILPAGAIACKALNIPKESLAEALSLCKRVAAVNTMFHTGVLDKTAMSSAIMSPWNWTSSSEKKVNMVE